MIGKKDNHFTAIIYITYCMYIFESASFRPQINLVGGNKGFRLGYITSTKVRLILVPIRMIRR